MTLPKYPSPLQVTQFIDDTARGDDEPMEAHVRRLLKSIVAANVATTVALEMGTSPGRVSAALAGERAQLAMICRIAEACKCEVTIRPVA